VRVSFGYMTTRRDVETLINLVKMHFVEATQSVEQELEKTLAAEAKETTQIKTEEKDEVVLESIVVYPVKSCRGMHVSEWPLGEAGLRWDRQWAVMQNGRVLTQKKEPILAQIQPTIDTTRGLLTLSCQGEGEVSVPLVGQEEGSTCSGSVCGERVEGRSCGEESSEWLEQVLGIPGVHLVRGVSRRSNRATRSSSLANDSDCLLVGLTSLRALASKVEETCARHGEQFADHFGEKGIADRFRANLIVEGGEAFGEESWSGFQIGGAEFKVGGPCRRCQMITVEQETGEVTKEPLRSLAHMKNRNFNFGVHTSLARASSSTTYLRVGQSITVIR